MTELSDFQGDSPAINPTRVMAMSFRLWDILNGLYYRCLQINN